MSYLYFPGCSLSSTGRAYDESLRYVFRALNLPMDEVKDWNCCGATAYMSISELQAIALSARNLALAEQQKGDQKTVDVVAPCAACYLVLIKAQRFLSESEEISTKVNAALAAANLSYRGDVKVRHPLDILANDVGLEKISAATKRPLKGLKVASYYGCQIVRPYALFDDQFNPQSMDQLLKAVGTESIDWPLKTRCCGGTLTGTIQDVGLRLSYLLLKEAKKRHADVIATACPLCQFNLECFQSKMGRVYGEEIQIPVVYFTQLLGLALGGRRRQLALQRLFVPLEPTLAVAEAKGAQNVNP